MIEINTDYHIIPPYPVMIAFSFFTGLMILYFLNVRDGIRKNVAGYFCLLAPVMSVFFGAVLTYISSGGKYFGLSSIGGLAGMYAASLTMALISGKSGEIRIMLKNCTLVLPLIYSISKIGCLLGGCCRGMAYHGVFCIHYTGSGTDSAYVFPVQLMETILFFIIFLLGMLLQRKIRNTVLLVFLFSSLTKFLLDFLRESHHEEIISFTQILCLLLIFAEFIILIYRKYRNMKNQV